MQGRQFGSVSNLNNKPNSSTGTIQLVISFLYLLYVLSKAIHCLSTLHAVPSFVMMKDFVGCESGILNKLGALPIMVKLKLSPGVKNCAGGKRRSEAAKGQMGRRRPRKLFSQQPDKTINETLIAWKRMGTGKEFGCGSCVCKDGAECNICSRAVVGDESGMEGLVSLAPVDNSKCVYGALPSHFYNLMFWDASWPVKLSLEMKADKLA